MALPGNGGSGIQALAVTTGGTPTTVLTDPSGLVVQGNRIGTNAAGTAAIPNNVGVNINAGSAQIGGTAAGQGNLISGNGGVGLNLTFQPSEGLSAGHAVVQRDRQGNIVGLECTGTTALPNGTSNNGTGMSIVSSNHTIGGTTAAASNMISGNGGATGGSGISIGTKQHRCSASD